MLREKLLIRRFNRGDRSALREMYRLYKDELVGLGAAMIRDKDKAEDIVHDIFARMVERQQNLRVSQNLRRYLITSVVNAVRQVIRNRVTRKPYQEATQTCENSHCLASEEPIMANIAKERTQQIALALQSLPHEQREVILLRHFSDLRFKTIAALQETSVNTVQGRYRYGIDKLRHLLNGDLL